MHRSVPLRRARAVAVVLLLALSHGCSSNEIPLIEFPKGAPPPQPAAPGSLPQGANTSRGEPAH